MRNDDDVERLKEHVRAYSKAAEKLSEAIREYVVQLEDTPYDTEKIVLAAAAEQVDCNKKYVEAYVRGCVPPTGR